MCHDNLIKLSLRIEVLDLTYQYSGILIIALGPNRHRVNQGSQAEGHNNGDQGICIRSPRVLALSHCVNLSNESGNSA